MPAAVIRPREIVHARSERGTHLMDAIMPAKQKHISVFLGTEEPLIPLLYLLPILLGKSTRVQLLLAPEVLQSQNQSRRVAVF